MQLLYFSHFLVALTQALLNSIWQVGLLWLVYQLCIKFSRTSSAIKFKILTLLQITGFTWFIVTLLNYTTSNNEDYLLNIFTQTKPIESSFLDSFLQLLAILYLFFTIVNTSKLLIQIIRANNHSNTYQLYTSPMWNEFSTKVAKQLSISKKIILKTTNENIIPYTIGIIKPIIVIPVAAINNLTAQQFEAIIIHEIAHIKRQDYILNLFLLVIERMMFFNPFVKLIYKEIDVERELCCDDIVINYPFATSQYAQALLNIAKTQVNNVSYISSLGIVSSNQQLKYRINRMLNSNNYSVAKFHKSYIGFTLAFATLIFSLVRFIDTNVKNIVSNAAATSFQQSFTKVPIKFNHSNNLSDEVNIKKTTSIKFATQYQPNQQNPVVASNSSTNINRVKASLLEQKKYHLEESLKQLAKNIASENKTLVVMNGERNLSDSFSQQKIEITPAIQKSSTSTVERFLIPATSQSSAAIILVTTITKEDGTKQVKIEIEKGKGSIE